MDDDRLRNLLALIQEAPDGFINGIEATIEEVEWLINEGVVEGPVNDAGVTIETQFAGPRTLVTKGSGEKSYILHLTVKGRNKLAQLRQ